MFLRVAKVCLCGLCLHHDLQLALEPAPVAHHQRPGAWGMTPLCPLLLCYQPAAATLLCFEPHNFSNT